MNSTDLHPLLAAPPVSRATFFAQLLATPGPRPQSELFTDDGVSEAVADAPTPATAPARGAATGFPA